MSILIKGVKMPRSCADCPLTWVDDEYDKRCCITDKVVLGTIGRQDNANCTDCDCPLIEVPTPHGRLIDGNQLETILANAIAMCTTVAETLECKDDPEIKMEIKAYTDILNGVKEQLTIIEAEGSEE